MATEGSNGFGQWLTPDDARRITASCNQVQTPTQQVQPSLLGEQSEGMSEMDMIAAQQEEADLNAAIAASLMDTGGPFASYNAAQGSSNSQDAPATEAAPSKDNNQEEADKSEPSGPPCEDTQELASGSDTKREVSTVEEKGSAKEEQAGTSDQSVTELDNTNRNCPPFQWSYAFFQFRTPYTKCIV